MLTKTTQKLLIQIYPRSQSLFGELSPIISIFTNLYAICFILYLIFLIKKDIQNYLVWQKKTYTQSTLNSFLRNSLYQKLVFKIKTISGQAPNISEMDLYSHDFTKEEIIEIITNIATIALEINQNIYDKNMVKATFGDSFIFIYQALYEPILRLQIEGYITPELMAEYEKLVKNWQKNKN